MNELWVKSRRILLSDDEYSEIKEMCKPEAYKNELVITSRKKLTPEELAETLERNIQMVELETVAELRTVDNVDEYADALYERLDDHTVSMMVRKARL